MLRIFDKYVIIIQMNCPVPEHFPRQKFQQEELGPIVNYLGAQFYDQAGQIWQPLTPDAFDSPITLANLGPFCGSLQEAIDAVVNFHYPPELEEHGSPENELIKSTRTIDEEGKEVGFTYHEDFNQVLCEGLYSGATLPLLTFRAIRSQKTRGTIEYDYTASEETIDLTSAANMLRSKSFQATLLSLAKAPHGYYGSVSTNLQFVNEDLAYPLGSNISASPFTLADGALSLNSSTKVFLRKTLAEVNASDADPFRNSSGCPARRTTYPILGEYAMAFAKQRGICPEDLMYQEKSVIIAGSEFVANALIRQDEVLARAA